MSNCSLKEFLISIPGRIVATVLICLLVLGTLFTALSSRPTFEAHRAAAAAVALGGPDRQALATWLRAAQQNKPTLKLKDRGQDVHGLQSALRLAGFDPGTLDGVFGPQTLAALTAYQEETGLEVDGLAGKQTRQNLAKTTVQALSTRHKIAPGETLSQIAQELGVQFQWLAELNDLSDPHRITAGTDLILPPKDVEMQEVYSVAQSVYENEHGPEPETVPAATQPDVAEEPQPEPEAEPEQELESPEEAGGAPAAPTSHQDPTETVVEPEEEPPPSQPSPSPADPDPSVPTAQMPGEQPHMIALTFNDGPHGQHTEDLLDVLAAHAVQATFFVVGSDAQAQPEIIRRMHDAGHQLENHTWSHTPLAELTRSQIEAELAQTAQLLADLTGRRPTLFRPPGGYLDTGAIIAAQRVGHRPLLWTNVGAESLPGTEAETLVRWLATPHPGAIIMLHGDSPEVTKALSQLLPRWQQLGIRLVTLDKVVP